MPGGFDSHPLPPCETGTIFKTDKACSHSLHAQDRPACGTSTRVNSMRPCCNRTGSEPTPGAVQMNRVRPLSPPSIQAWPWRSPVGTSCTMPGSSRTRSMQRPRASATRLHVRRPGISRLGSCREVRQTPAGSINTHQAGDARALRRDRSRSCPRKRGLQHPPAGHCMGRPPARTGRPADSALAFSLQQSLVVHG